jgi:hypothetical protein
MANENWNDYSYVESRIKENPELITKASEEIQVLLAKNYQNLIKYLGKEIQVSIVRSAATRHYLHYADEEVQKQIIAENKTRLCYASKEIQKEILKQNPLLLEHASMNIVADEKFVFELIAQNPLAMQHVYGLDGFEDVRILNEALDENPQLLKDFPENMQTAILTQNSNGEELLKYASNDVQATMISRDASYLAYASPEVRNNDEVVRNAVAKNPSMYNYASDRLRDDVEVQKAMVEADFGALDMLSAEQRENPIFAEQKQKWDIVERFRFDAIKLDDIDKQNFVDINFYNTIVAESKNKVLRRFDSLTQGMEMSDKVEEKLQAQVEKKLKQVESKLHRQRDWALFKNGIKTKIDDIKAKFNKGFEAGVVASEIKHMEL